MVLLALLKCSLTSSFLGTIDASLNYFQYPYDLPVTLDIQFLVSYKDFIIVLSYAEY